MFVMRGDDRLRKEKHQMSAEALFCSPLGIQPGIVRQTRKKFASDSDCSTLHCNGTLSIQSIGGSANACLKATYEGLFTFTFPTESRLNAPVRVYRRPPLPNNEHSKVYSSESNLYDDQDLSTPRWDNMSFRRNTVVHVPEVSDKKIQNNQVDNRPTSPGSSVAATRNVFENFVASLAMRNNPRVDGQMLCSNSESSTCGSLFDQENSRIRSLSLNRDHQNFQPPLLTSGQQGFGFPHTVRHSMREMRTNDKAGQSDQSKVEWKAVDDRQPQMTILESRGENRTPSRVNSNKEMTDHTPLKSCFNAEAATDEVTEDKVTKGRCTNSSGSVSTSILKDHTPFSYITSPTVLSRQISLLKSPQWSPTSTKSNSSNNMDIKPGNQRRTGYTEASHDGIEDPMTDRKPKQRDNRSTKCKQKQMFIPNYFVPCEPSSSTENFDQNKATAINHTRGNETQLKQRQGDVAEPGFAEARLSASTEHPGTTRKPISVLEYKYPDTVRGSALLSSIRDEPIQCNRATAHHMKVTHAPQSVNFRTYHASNTGTNIPVKDNDHVECNNKQRLKAIGEQNKKAPSKRQNTEGEQHTTKDELKDSVNKFYSNAHQCSVTASVVGKSHPNCGTRSASSFKANRADTQYTQKIFVQPKGISMNQENRTNDSIMENVPQTAQSSTPPKHKMDDATPHKEEEPHLTTREITGILEKKLKFRTQPPRDEDFATRGVTVGLISHTDKQVEPSSNNDVRNNDVGLKSAKCDAKSNSISFDESNSNSHIQLNNQFKEQKHTFKPGEVDKSSTSFTKDQFVFMYGPTSFRNRSQISLPSLKVPRNSPESLPTGVKTQISPDTMRISSSKSPTRSTKLVSHEDKRTVPQFTPNTERKDSKVANPNESREDANRFNSVVPDIMESMPTPYKPLASSLKIAANNLKQSTSSDSKTPSLNSKIDSSTTKTKKQPSNQTIIKRPDFSQIAKKLEEQFKHGAGLTRSQSSLLSTISSSADKRNRDSSVPHELVSSENNLTNLDEASLEEQVSSKANRSRPRSLDILEDDDLRPVRMKLFKELTETLARRSGNFDEKVSLNKSDDTQPSRSILRPKSAEATHSTHPKPRISFPPDDKLATTHDYEAEPRVPHGDTDSEGSAGDEDPNAVAHNVTETDDSGSTDSTLINQPFMRRHRNLFPRPKWSTGAKPLVEPTPNQSTTNVLDNGSNRHFPRLATTELPLDARGTPERPSSAPAYAAPHQNDSNPPAISPTRWKPYPSYLY